LIPSHWKRAVIKPAFSAGSSEVFDVSEIQTINEKYKSIAAEKELLLQNSCPDSNNRRNFLYLSSRRF
jgi:glutathione synthase/RimK-type ligase-like ATP-grasp enzyme